MFIRSNRISREDVNDAVRTARERGHDVVIIDPVRQFKPRSFARGFEVFLGAFAGRHASAHDPSWKAASWVAWGEVIDYLSLIDPDAQIAFYRDRAHFLEWTSSEAERPGRPESREDCPWLVRLDEWQRRDDLITEALGVAPGEVVRIEVEV